MNKKKSASPAANGTRPKRIKTPKRTKTPKRVPFPQGLSERHKIDQLPKDLKKELDQRLADGDFRSSYILSDWLLKNGFEISHQALNQYQRKFDRRLDAIRLATEQARIVCAQFKDDDIDMQTALLRLVQTRLFEVLSAINEQAAKPGTNEDVEPAQPGAERLATVNLTALARTVSGLARAETENRKWAERAREAVALAAKKLDDSKGKGLTPNVANQIRAVLMEI
jgi:hypothetical protein